MPLDFHRLTKKHTRGKVYIVKPENGCQGQGIYLTGNVNGLEKERGQVVQEYVANPMLIDGLKFDLRIYVLLTSVKPLRIYLYKEGMARFAT
jgi:tubulin polyglutamylase TTLL6/13